MKRSNEVVELGIASRETQGAPGGIFELSGHDRQVGISDE